MKRFKFSSPRVPMEPKLLWAQLSAREQQVARLVAQSKSNPEIANALQIERSTVESHLKSIFGKLYLRSRVELAIFVLKHAD